MVVKFHYHCATERRYWNFSTIVQTEWVLEFQYPPAKYGTEISVPSCEMWYWNCSTIVQTERVLKFRYPSAKCGTEILILSSDHSLNSQIWFYTNMVLKFKCSPHIERWALSAYVSIYWLLATRLANHGVVRRVDHGVVSLHPTVCYAGVCTRTMPHSSMSDLPLHNHA